MKFKRFSSRKIVSFGACVVLACVLSACGGDASESTTTPAPALATNLAWVDVQDASGLTVMQHRFSAGADTNEDVVTTTEYQGNDGIWGTSDDWQTAVVSCHFQAGDALDQRMLISSLFRPENLLNEVGVPCFWRRPLVGSITVSTQGAYTGSGIFEGLSAIASTPTGQILLSILGIDPASTDGSYTSLLPVRRFLGLIPPDDTALTFSISDAGVRRCASGCEEEIVFAGSPESMVCQVNCEGLGNIVYDTFLPPAPPAGVKVYKGTQYFPVYEDGRLHRLVQSAALDQPLEYLSQYDAFYYSGDALVSEDTYSAQGADGQWFTGDDVLSAYFNQQPLADGWQRLHYNGAGEDGVWKTADDLVQRSVALHRDDKNRIASVQVCEAAGPDAVWQTADDVCKALIFHYSGS